MRPAEVTTRTLQSNVDSPLVDVVFDSYETASPYDMGGYGRCASIGISNPRPWLSPTHHACVLCLRHFSLVQMKA